MVKELPPWIRGSGVDSGFEMDIRLNDRDFEKANFLLSIPEPAFRSCVILRDIGRIGNRTP